MNKLYSVHDHWTDIAKKNDVDIISIDGEITRIKVNGEDYGGGGGSKYETVFEGNVTTETSGDNARAIVEGYNLTANTIKVTFNGTEYTCEFNSATGYGAGYDDTTQEIDWSEYPFNIFPRGGALIIRTQSTGTYSLKIEEPQSGGGSSDFSTAEVTIVNGGANPDASELEFVGLDLNDELRVIIPSEAGVYESVLYKNKSVIHTNTDTFVSCEGNATYETEGGQVIITMTGDCTITIQFTIVG